MPNRGFENSVRIFTKAGLSLRGATAPLIVSMPNIRTAKPRRIIPPFLLRLPSFPFMYIKMPAAARTGAKALGLRSLSSTLSLCIPARDSIHEVTVVPMFAPIITPTAWLSFMIPELTKPTTITVVADDDCMAAVTAIPRISPLMRLSVSFSRILSSLLPENLIRPSPITLIPYKNIARPPTIVKIPNISIFLFVFLSSLICLIGFILQTECKTRMQGNVKNR